MATCATEFLSPEQIAEKLQKPVKTVRSYCRDGIIKAVKIGGDWRIDPADYETFLAGLRQPEATR
jgi:excisionase family DNA binding protein